MKGFRFRVRALLALVAVAALLLAATEARLRRARPRGLRPSDGPFLIFARSFRGPDAERDALSLASELRADHGHPAYLYRRGSGRSSRPPEFAVLIGDARTLDDANRLLHSVKRIRLKTSPGRSGGPVNLRRAFMTQNPVLISRKVVSGTRRPSAIQESRRQ